MGKIKHRASHTTLYNIWCGIIQRCNNPNNGCYKQYGAIGISICSEWEKDYIAFRDWSLSHGYQKGLTIDRIDGTKGYSPDNCRWVTMKEQAVNRKSTVLITYNGITQPLKYHCASLNIPLSKVYNYARYHGITSEEAFWKVI